MKHKYTGLALLAALVAIGASPAWGAEVVSSNIVGYEKISLVAGLNMVSAQFIPVGSSALERDISTVGVLDDTMTGYDDEYTYGTELLVWDSTRQGYTSYGWAGTSPGEIDNMPELNNTWLDAATEETEDTLATTAGAWIRAGTAGTFTVSGEVPSQSTVSLSLVAGLNMVANPYPAAVPVSTFGMLDASMAGYDEEYTYATELLVWNPARQGYTSYGWAGTSPGEIDNMPELNNTWLDAATEETEDTIPYGAAVWIRCSASGTITFSSPSIQ